MFNWLKGRMTRAAANQCRFNIKLNAQTLVSIANKANVNINQIGSSSDVDKKRVLAAQNSLLEDIQLGMANELTMQDIRTVIRDALNGLEVSKGAEMAIEHVLSTAESSKVKGK